MIGAVNEIEPSPRHDRGMRSRQKRFRCMRSRPSVMTTNLSWRPIPMTVGVDPEPRPSQSRSCSIRHRRHVCLVAKA